MTRTGAAAIEIMKETYLFRKISEEDTDVLSISRNMQPVSYIVGPLVASVFISYIDLKYVFLALGIIMLWGGIRYSWAIQDTK
jgi:ABC-type transporter Mla maintaining outer membrane lipid asymmetry permease subunit MlaE